MPDETLTGDAALPAEHEARRRRTSALGHEHERLRAAGSEEERRAHRVRLRHNLIALEQHYARLRQSAAGPGRPHRVETDAAAQRQGNPVP